MTANPPPLKPGDHVFLIDGSSFVFRAYFQSINQDRKYNVRSDGLPVGAVRLFCTKVLQWVQDGVMGIKPTHLAIIFDKSENSFRKALYPAYKAHRPPPPEDLIPQFPLMREAVKAFGMIPIEQDVYEADDLIATYARQAVEKGADVLIVSADKDLMQLIQPGVAMYDPASGENPRSKGYRPERKIGRQEVIDYFGVPPDKVPDVQALAGDSTDNVPGASGIGMKTAAQLINEYGDLDTLLARAEEIKQPKRREALTEPAAVEKIRISHKLVTLVQDVDVVTPLEDTRFLPPDGKALVAFLKAMEFSTITRRVAQIFDVDMNEVSAATVATKHKAVAEEEVNPATTGDLEATPKSRAEAALASMMAVPIDRSAYETVTSKTALEPWLAQAREQGFIAFDTETTSLDAMQADLVGFSLGTAPGKACYVPLQHRAGESHGLFDTGLTEGQMPLADALEALKELCEDTSILKIGQNIKYDMLVLARHGIALRNYDDTMLLSYALDAGLHGHGMDELSQLFFDHAPIPFNEVAGSGKNAIGFARVAIDKATAYAAEDADVTLRLWHVLKPRLVSEAKVTLYETLERPMPAVISAMEERGILIDRQVLSRLSGEFAQKQARYEAEAQEMAGETFNLGSPKQIGDILFGKFSLPGGAKTKTGAWSTSASVLDELAEMGHDLPKKILEWRAMAKLRSTYTDALPGYIHPQTGRVHTSFSLAATTTGRLSSSEPNIQNIPVRTEDGRRIRTAFIAPPGRKLISADYSQIELRLLAHIADIPALKKAFADGVDIHAMTASEMFGVPVRGMPSDVRRRAKAINFGIIYGISAFGLANQLSIPREEASAYIKKYFERFPGIRAYMDATKAACKAQGYVETLFGRKCHYPAIQSPNAAERAFVERQAINAPIQGSASDIIRRAMARMDEALKNAGLSALMLLQVHDELVFEVPDDEVEATLPVIKKVMRDAPHPALQLSVPLEVEASAAKNWDEAH
jgi:DNA polymerase-1